MYKTNEADYNITQVVDDVSFGKHRHPMETMSGIPGLSDIWGDITEQGGRILRSEIQETGARVASTAASTVMERPEVKAMATAKAKEAAIATTAQKLTETLAASQAAFKKYKTQIMIGVPVVVGGLAVLWILRKRKK